VKGRLK
jgi:hypothetical protein